MIDQQTRKQAEKALLNYSIVYEELRDLASEAGIQPCDIIFPHGQTPTSLVGELIRLAYGYGVLDKLVELAKPPNGDPK